MKPRWAPRWSQRGGAVPIPAGLGARGSLLLIHAYLGGRAAVRRGLRVRSAGRPWRRGALLLLLSTAATATGLAGAGLHHVYRDRTNLPDLGPLIRFEFPTIGHVYDTHGHPLIALARERRQMTRFDEIPPIVRDAILAAEDKNFFSHDGIDYASLPRVVSKVRIGNVVTRLMRAGRHDETRVPRIFPQGGSTVTQQLVRGVFLGDVTAHENQNERRHGGLLPRVMSFVTGPRSVNVLARKLEELRLAVWVEQEMQDRFGSKRRAKEEILARYASFIYMGRGQYGFAAAAEHYFRRPLVTLSGEDADTAALLAGIAKAPRDYAPDAHDTARVVRRRNQTLALMEANGSISHDTMTRAAQRALPVAPRGDEMLQAPAVVAHVLEALEDGWTDLSVEDLLEGRIQVYATVDAQVQRVVNEALEHGLARYEKRRPSAKGLLQGAVVVLRNGDASVLAEAGGRQSYNGRPAAYSDFIRVTTSQRQPGSAMKPLVYLAAFREQMFDLDTMVPDEPIGIPMGAGLGTKWISNYDRQFKGVMPLRQALAESRNAVAVWIAGQIGIESVLRTSRSLGVLTPLQPYPATALGASEVTLLELANAYRAMASGIVAQPYVIRTIARTSGGLPIARAYERPAPIRLDDSSLALIQEGLRGVVRMPTGTAHSLDSGRFAIPVMGKTGTTSEFRDALFVGSTYGPDGVTVAVRIGFDDNRSLGAQETGGRVALPVFREIMLAVYGGELAGPVPAFPPWMERRITRYLQGDSLGVAPSAPR